MRGARQNALNKNVHDAINVQRSKAKAVVITVERSSAHQYSVRLLLVGLLLTVAGIVIYYGLPSALLANDVALLFNIFLVLLAGMMIGLVLLALNLQPLLESFLVWLLFKLFFFESRALPAIVWKNLQAHRSRNRKTAITYAVALGFIIFLSVGVRLELRSSTYSEMQSYGTPLRVRIELNSFDGTRGIEPTAALEQWAAAHPDVTDFAWTSFPLSTTSAVPTETSLTNRGRCVHGSAGAPSPQTSPLIRPRGHRGARLVGPWGGGGGQVYRRGDVDIRGAAAPVRGALPVAV